MLLRLGYDLQFELPEPATCVAQLRVHPSRAAGLRSPDEVHPEPGLPVENYTDSFGNLCARFLAPAGLLRLSNSVLLEDSGEPDPAAPGSLARPIAEVPVETLRFLLPSRYCEVDSLAAVALDLFSNTTSGWERVQAICNWVHWKVSFGYEFARPTKTALDVFTERKGVCRDFQHLAITFCRALGIPARYAAGYLGDIRIPPTPSPMDFSAWFEVYLEDRWWTFDARHNTPRVGRVLMATGRDAADVAFFTSFGRADLKSFLVISEEVNEDGGPANAPSAG
ncbi:MAG TPA: transglutaminase family protein [Acidobacteriaceae bacterium]|jgi:transglutaminase-like putative cysteine protease|nr:transglutaminase family protein [Acidobacteriaceae bacterium]